MTIRRSKVLLLLLLCTLLSGCGIESQIIYTEDIEPDYVYEAPATATSSLYDVTWSAFEAREYEPFSPLSMFTVSALLSNATNGATREQIENACQMSTDELNHVVHQNSGALPMHTAMWVKMGANLSPNREFLSNAVTYLDADIFATVFDLSAIKTINSWVAKNTGDPSATFLDNISTYSRLYAACTSSLEISIPNVIDIKESRFYPDGQTTVYVPMLHFTASKYVERLHIKGFMTDIPDAGVTVVGLLPDKGVDMSFLLSTLSGDDIYNLINNPKRFNVDVTLPAIQEASQHSLNPVLQKLGIADAYSKSNANFLQMGVADERLFLNDAVAYTSMTVNGEVTNSSPITTSQTLCFDRPFLLVVLNTETGIPLYINLVKC